jgi:hypothetical protein
MGEKAFKVSVMINYCSNERAFIDALLTQCLIFSSDIVVSYGSHLYDGAPEDLDHIAQCQSAFPTVKFVSYPVDITLDLNLRAGVNNRPTAYWHNLARWTAYQALTNKEWAFVIDADEIPDGMLVAQWLERVFPLLKKNECYKMANYWYFKDPMNRAETLEDSVLLIHAAHINKETVFGDNERDHLLRESGCKPLRRVRGRHNEVLWNHFSWCRSRKGMEHKIRNWAHSNDLFKNADVAKVVAFIFQDDNVNDVVHRYSYTKVPNKFNLIF